METCGEKNIQNSPELGPSLPWHCPFFRPAERAVKFIRGMGWGTPRTMLSNLQTHFCQIQFVRWSLCHFRHRTTNQNSPSISTNVANATITENNHHNMWNYLGPRRKLSLRTHLQDLVLFLSVVTMRKIYFKNILLSSLARASIPLLYLKYFQSRAFNWLLSSLWPLTLSYVTFKEVRSFQKKNYI